MTGKSSPQSSYSKNIVLLGIVSLINDFSSEMILPILPLFIESLGAKAFAIGVIGGLTTAVVSLVKVGFGWFSDRFSKRKPFVAGGYVCSAGCKIVLSTASTWGGVAIITAMERVGKGVRTAPRDALIAASASKGQGRAFGLHRTMDTAGALLGAGAAYICVTVFALDYSNVILIGGLLAIVALVPLIWVKDPTQGPHYVTGKNADAHSNSASVNHQSEGRKLCPASNVGPFIAVAGLFSLGNISYMFLLIRASHFMPPNMHAAGPVALYILYNLIYALLSYPAGIIGDRVGKGRIIASGYLLLGGVLLGFGFVSSWYLLPTLFACYGIVMALIDGNQRALVSQLTIEQRRGTLLGTYHAVVGIATIPGNLLAGYLAEQWSWTTAFATSASVAALSALLLVISCSRLIVSPSPKG